MTLNEAQIKELKKFTSYLEKRAASNQKGREEAALLNSAIYDMEKELESLRAFKHNIDEALNSGDGSYRP